MERERITVEWIYAWEGGTSLYRRVETRLKESRKGNIYFEIGGDPYVLSSKRTGAPVLGIKRGLWKNVGRVIGRGNRVFIGAENEPSSDESRGSIPHITGYQMESMDGYLQVTA